MVGAGGTGTTGKTGTMKTRTGRWTRGRCNLLIVLALCLGPALVEARGVVVLQSDFGLRDQAVAAMRGVIMGVSTELAVHDLTHEIPAYDIWQASYRLAAVVEYWPPGSVFVSVVDPGVGTDRVSVVAETASGHYIVTPDNGTLTLIADGIGIRAVRRIDERVNRLPGSAESHTFHGRDVYAYTGARLASGATTFADIGALREQIVRIPYQPPRQDGRRLLGTIPVLDPQYGNVWTNLPRALLQALLPADEGGAGRLAVRISHAGVVHYAAEVPLVDTFGAVPPGAELAYYNSLGNLSLAVNQGNFAARHGVHSGNDWHVSVCVPTANDDTGGCVAAEAD